MLSAEAEKKVREIAKEAAEKAVVDYQAVEEKQTSLSGVVAEVLEREVRSLVRKSDQLFVRVEGLENEVKRLQNQVDDLKSASVETSEE